MGEGGSCGMRCGSEGAEKAHMMGLLGQSQRASDGLPCHPSLRCCGAGCVHTGFSPRHLRVAASGFQFYLAKGQEKSLRHSGRQLKLAFRDSMHAWVSFSSKNTKWRRSCREVLEEGDRAPATSWMATSSCPTQSNLCIIHLTSS